MKPAPRHGAAGPHRRKFGLATAVSGTVAGVFLTLGDGIESHSDGFRGIVLDYAHTAVWVLLTISFSLATVRGWNRASNLFASLALATYAGFVATLFSDWP